MFLFRNSKGIDLSLVDTPDFEKIAKKCLFCTEFIYNALNGNKFNFDTRVKNITEEEAFFIINNSSFSFKDLDNGDFIVNLYFTESLIMRIISIPGFEPGLLITNYFYDSKPVYAVIIDNEVDDSKKDELLIYAFVNMYRLMVRYDYASKGINLGNSGNEIRFNSTNSLILFDYMYCLYSGLSDLISGSFRYETDVKRPASSPLVDRICTEESGKIRCCVFEESPFFNRMRENENIDFFKKVYYDKIRSVEDKFTTLDDLLGEKVFN